MTDRTASPWCTETELRESLDDAAFWPYVLQRQLPGDPEEPDVDDIVSMVSNQGQPCPECGEYTACAYDAEGRPMVHTTPNDDKEDDDERSD